MNKNEILIKLKDYEEDVYSYFFETSDFPILNRKAKAISLVRKIERQFSQFTYYNEVADFLIEWKNKLENASYNDQTLDDLMNGLPHHNIIALINKYLEKSPKKRNTITSNNPDLNQVETSLLIMYLKNNGVFRKDLTNERTSQLFEDLTGYKHSFLYTSIVGKAKKDHSEIDVKPINYDKLQMILNNIMNQIDIDKKK